MEKYHFKEAAVAGLVGGILLIVIQMIILPVLSNTNAWEFPSVMANTLLNSTAPDVAVFMVGMIMPVLLTVLLALTMGWIPSTWHPWAMAPVGLMFGTVVYIIYFLFFISITRQMADMFTLWHYFSFVAYGVIIAVVYQSQVRAKYKALNPAYEGV